ncbi:MAG: CapA family protein [Clostridia bacterium]|nr:CapA family protein [Clostridia bacterium]
MKRRVLLAFLLMMTAASVCAAQMNYDLMSPYLIYTQLGGEEILELIDVHGDAAGGAEDAGDVSADDGAEMISLEELAQAEEALEADVWPKTFTITVAGDTTLGSTDDLRKRDDCFENVAQEKGYGWFFSGLTSLFGSDDLTLINFEGTLTEETTKTQKKFNFKGPADYADIVTLGEVEAVNIANNHIIDYGDQGKADTIANLEAAGLIVSGGGLLGIFEKNGVKVGMTGYCFPYKDSKKDISADVKALREAGCQIVVATFHWGSEYQADFTAEQRSIGRAALKAGADIVVGHHPHIVQGIEAYNDSYILYSLGNLVFGGNVDPDDRDAYAARLTFTVYEDHADAPELTIVPLRLTELEKGTDYRPVLAEGEEADRIVSRILKKSYNMSDFVNGTW